MKNNFEKEYLDKPFEEFCINKDVDLLRHAMNEFVDKLELYIEKKSFFSKTRSVDKAINLFEKWIRTIDKRKDLHLEWTSTRSYINKLVYLNLVYFKAVAKYHKNGTLPYFNNYQYHDFETQFVLIKKFCKEILETEDVIEYKDLLLIKYSGPKYIDFTNKIASL